MQPIDLLLPLLALPAGFIMILIGISGVAQVIPSKRRSVKTIGVLVDGQVYRRKGKSRFGVRLLFSYIWQDEEYSGKPASLSSPSISDERSLRDWIESLRVETTAVYVDPKKPTCFYLTNRIGIRDWAGACVFIGLGLMAWFLAARSML